MLVRAGMAQYLHPMPWHLNVFRQACALRASWMTAKSALLAKLDWPSLRWRRDIAAVTLLHGKLQDRREPFSTVCLKAQKQGPVENHTSFFFLMPPPLGF